jgi:hypothetical protein
MQVPIVEEFSNFDELISCVQQRLPPLPATPDMPLHRDN